MANPRLRAAVAVAAVALFAAACGSETTEPPAETTSSTTTTSTTLLPTTSTVATTTTEPEPVGPISLALDEVPALVLAWGDGTGDPLELAQEIIGFPLPIPTPPNTSALAISVDMFGGDLESPWEWDWTYEVLSSDPMPEIDIHAAEDTPGEIALREFYDPIMAELGWTYSGSTGSDPGDVGGPNSINHVYQSDEPTLTVNGLTAAPLPAFVWADEEQVFGEGVPGYQIDVPFEFEPDLIPVPIVQTIINELPDLLGAQIVDVDILSVVRPESSFDAEHGLRYFEFSVEWALSPGTSAEVKQALSIDLGPSAFFPGEESFFDPGFVEATEPRIFGDGWTQPMVFLDRYEGSAQVSGDDSVGATLEIDVRFEPNRTVLEELPD